MGKFPIFRNGGIVKAQEAPKHWYNKLLDDNDVVSIIKNFKDKRNAKSQLKANPPLDVINQGKPVVVPDNGDKNADIYGKNYETTEWFTPSQYAETIVLPNGDTRVVYGDINDPSQNDTLYYNNGILGDPESEWVQRNERYGNPVPSKNAAASYDKDKKRYKGVQKNFNKSYQYFRSND